MSLTNSYLVPPYSPSAYSMSFALFLQVRLGVNQTILLHEDMQENKEVEEAFMNFFEKKLRYWIHLRYVINLFSNLNKF